MKKRNCNIIIIGNITNPEDIAKAVQQGMIAINTEEGEVTTSIKKAANSVGETATTFGKAGIMGIKHLYRGAKRKISNLIEGAEEMACEFDEERAHKKEEKAVKLHHETEEVHC